MRRTLGAGGFAVVWLGYDDRLEDLVAIKVLAENFAQRLDVRDRFVEEARRLRRTRSHHVVEVYDIDELPDGRPYFVMTHADGGSLADLLAEGPLPVDEALRIGADVARGVQDLHDAGVLHRDVKPSNVLFRMAPDGTRTVLVADLGLSRELARGSRLTLSAGTPGFMAPEQATHSGVDHRTDVYGIGATVHNGLTGHEPPAGGPPPPPSSLRPGLQPAVDAVVLRATATDPGDRWPTAGALADALDGLRGGAPAPRPARRWVRPALLVGALAVVAAGVTWVAGMEEPATSSPERIPCTTVDGTPYTECFLQARGGYLLDFYSHNHDVVLWGRKPDDDTYAFSQRWQFLRTGSALLVHNAHTDRCLALDDRVRVEPCDATDPGQRWTTADGVLRSELGGCLDVPDGDYPMGTVPFAHDCHGGLGQRWQPLPTR